MITNNNMLTADLLNLIRRFVDEVRQRGTKQIYMPAGGLKPVDGEYLRAFGYQNTDEFIASFQDRKYTSWNIGNSSPVYKGLLDKFQVNKLWVKTDDFPDLLSIPYSASNGTVSTVVDGSKQAIRYLSAGSAGADYIGSVVETPTIPISPNIDYELVFYIKVAAGTFSLTMEGFDKDNNLLNFKKALDASSSSAVFTNVSFAKTDTYYRVSVLLFASCNSALPYLATPNILQGNNLILPTNIAYVAPKFTFSQSVASDVRIWSLCLRPLRYDASRGYIHSGPWLDSWFLQRNFAFSEKEILDFTRKYLLPYNSNLRQKTLNSCAVNPSAQVCAVPTDLLVKTPTTGGKAGDYSYSVTQVDGLVYRATNPSPFEFFILNNKGERIGVLKPNSNLLINLSDELVDGYAGMTYVHADGTIVVPETFFADSTTDPEEAPPPPEPDVCGIPTNLVVSNVAQTTARISWQYSGTHLNFTLDYRIVGAGSWTSVTVSALFKDLTGLTAGTQYEFRIKTNCTVSTSSPYSSIALFTTNYPSCAAPSGLNITGIGTTTATVNWTNSPDATSYELIVQLSGGAQTTYTPSGTPQALTGLTAGSDYIVILKSICGTQSSSSIITNFSTNSATPVSCPIPANLAVANLTFNSFRLTWDSSVNAFEYVVSYAVASGTPVWTDVTVVNPFYDLTGLTSGTEYQWKVKARCAAALYSSEVAGTNFTILTCPQVENLLPLEVFEDSIKITWDAIPGVTQYRVVVNGGSPTVVSATEFEITGLTPSTTYTFEVQTMCTGTSFSTANTLQVTTAPASCDPVDTSSISTVLENSVTLNWTSSLHTGSTEYDIIYWPANDPAAQIMVTVTGVLTKVINALLPDTSYIVGVRRICNAITSDKSGYKYLGVTTAPSATDPDILDRVIEYTATGTEATYTNVKIVGCTIQVSKEGTVLYQGVAANQYQHDSNAGLITWGTALTVGQKISIIIFP